MNILGGNPISEGCVIVGGSLDSVLQTVFEEEFEKDAVKLHRNGFKISPLLYRNQLIRVLKLAD